MDIFFLSFGLVLITVSRLPVDGGLNCPADHYLDHGTGHCEHCSDVCHLKEYKNTEDDCLQLCPGYGHPASKEPTSTQQLSSAVKIGIGASAVVTSLAVFLAVLKRRTIAQFLRQAPPAERETRRGEARQPLSGIPVGVGVAEVGPEGTGENRPVTTPYEESVVGRRGKHELALLRDRSDDRDDENMEPKTIHESAEPYLAYSDLQTTNVYSINPV